MEEIKAKLTDEQVLAFTQNIRSDLVTEMVKGGVPKDKEDRQLLLSALSDMDKTAIGSMRIKVDSDANNTVAQAHHVIASILGKLPGHREREVFEDRSIPVLGNEVPEPVLVPGELETNPGTMDFETFTKQQAAIQDQE